MREERHFGTTTSMTDILRNMFTHKQKNIAGELIPSISFQVEKEIPRSEALISEKT